MPAAFDELAAEWRMGLVVLGMLVAASLLVAALKRLRPASDFSELAPEILPSIRATRYSLLNRIQI